MAKAKMEEILAELSNRRPEEKPNVDVVAEWLGVGDRDVSAAVRDEAWEAYQQLLAGEANHNTKQPTLLIRPKNHKRFCRGGRCFYGKEWTEVGGYTETQRTVWEAEPGLEVKLQEQPDADRKGDGE